MEKNETVLELNRKLVCDDISEVFLVFLHKDICDGHSLEVPCWGSSDEWS